ncbi:MAG: von Willebrand factor type A domain protein [Candidatus Argoarchaeum ethanivorans]|uniref:von Willebrand factor type A domain protein n=1 Tax=Candidatus Argoarchaeum ethanivorans TaxID=2608793 RepID=A0A811ZZL4_9EURY|nr:MAG: von Willebrand factor type A domain protein [Candidatus Argoarchaeum ethanivorans]
MNVQEPLLLLLISPVLLLGFYMLRLRSGANRALVLSRMVIISLLIIALSNPFVIASHTIRDDTPSVTVVADKTISCDLFDTSQAESLQEYLKTRTPTKYKEVTGIKTALGDAILKNSASGEHIVLVSDLNNNHGVNMGDAVILARREGAHIYAVEQTPIHTDTGVEIAGSKNIIVGNENTYHIIIRHVGEEITYKLTVQIDGNTLYTETITQIGHEKVIPLPYTPLTEGAHRITATIAPEGDDRFKLNNVFYKSVFAAPKPKVLYTGCDSPLKTVLAELYDLHKTTLDGAKLEDYKVVIIENKDAKTLDPHVQNLKSYTANGGALLVVGGDNSFDRGEYNNSDIEKALPVLSKPSKYGGGRNVVIVIDASGSTDWNLYNDIKFIGHIDALAQSIVNNRNIGADTKIGVIAFGSSAEEIGFLSATSENKMILNKKIANIWPKSKIAPTSMDQGLKSAQEMLKEASGVKLVIVLSDGNIRENKNEIETAAKELVDEGITLYFRQVGIGPKSARAFTSMEDIAETAGADYEYIGTKGLNIHFEPLPEEEEEKEEKEVLHLFGLIITDSEHFITQYQNVSRDLTGYNDITPKIGARRLVAITIGKPVLTVWNFGLGRTAAISTDNGNRWAGVLYTEPNSKLISSTVNWLIGDPRPAGDTITAPDLWLGTPGRVTIKTAGIPDVSFDNKSLSFTKEGDHYTAVIDPKEDGFYNIAGYEIAANYPLEYREIGFNEEMRAHIEEYNGSVHPFEEAKTLLLGDIKANSVRVVNEPVSAKMPFIIASLIIFLGEVILRRLRQRKITSNYTQREEK